MTIADGITHFVRAAAWKLPHRSVSVGSVHASDTTLYSYGDHMPLVQVLDSRTGDLLVNEGDSRTGARDSGIVRYGSVTTARHARYVAGALVALGYERAGDGPAWACWGRLGGRCRTGVYTRG